MDVDYDQIPRKNITVPDCYQEINSIIRNGNPNRFHKRKLKKPYGLESKLTKEDHQVFPEEFLEEHDLFEKFYENIIKTRLINRYIDEVKTHFEDSTECELKKNEDIPELLSKCIVPTAHISKRIILQGEKGYLANYNITEGEEILVEKAAFLCKSPNCECNNHSTYECYHCSKTITEVYQCSTCCLVVFCSDKCCHIATEKYHKWECNATKFHFFKKGDTMQLALRMMFVKMMSQLEKPPLRIKQQEMNVLQLPSMLKNASTDFLKMALKKIAFIIIYLVEETSFFDWLLRNVMPKTSFYDSYLQVGGYLLKYACLAARFSTSFQEEDMCLLVDSKGMNFSCPSFTYTLTKFEHSCQPNAVVLTRRNYVTIKAGTDIEKGTEITISHIGLDLFQSHHDRKSALSSKMINCNCSVCTLDINVQYDNIIYRCWDCDGRLLRLWPKWKCYDCKKNYESELYEFTRLIYFEEMEKLENASKIPNISEENRMFLTNNLRFGYFPTERHFNIVLKIFSYFLRHKHCQEALFHQINVIQDMNAVGYKYSYVKVNLIICMINTIFAYIEKVRKPFFSMDDILSQPIHEFVKIHEFFGLELEYYKINNIAARIKSSLSNQYDEGMMTNDENSMIEMNHFSVLRDNK